MNKLAIYSLRVFLQPVKTFEQLSKDPERFKIGTVSMVLMSLFYTLVCVFLALLHGTPNPAPFLRIATKNYFYWAQFFYAPALISGMVLAGGGMYLLAKVFKGKGSADDTFALVAFATATATLPALIPDLLLTSVQLMGFMDYGKWFYSVTHGGAWFYIIWVYLLAYLFCFLIFYPAAMRAAHRLSWKKVVAVGWLGFAVYQGFIFVFIR